MYIRQGLIARCAYIKVHGYYLRRKKMKKGIFAILALLVVFAMVSIGCPDDGGENKQRPAAPGTEVTVTFDKNNTDVGSTDPDPATKKVTIPVADSGLKATVSLPTKAPTRPGYIFTGYNTKADGSGTEFKKDTPVTGNITVYDGRRAANRTVTG